MAQHWWGMQAQHQSVRVGGPRAALTPQPILGHATAISVSTLPNDACWLPCARSWHGLAATGHRVCEGQRSKAISASTQSPGRGHVAGSAPPTLLSPRVGVGLVGPILPSQCGHPGAAPRQPLPGGVSGLDIGFPERGKEMGWGAQAPAETQLPGGYMQVSCHGRGGEPVHGEEGP